MWISAFYLWRRSLVGNREFRDRIQTAAFVSYLKIILNQSEAESNLKVHRSFPFSYAFFPCSFSFYFFFLVFWSSPLWFLALGFWALGVASADCGGGARGWVETKKEGDEWRRGEGNWLFNSSWQPDHCRHARSRHPGEPKFLWTTCSVQHTLCIRVLFTLDLFLTLTRSFADFFHILR